MKVDRVVLQFVKLELEFSNTCIKRYRFSTEIPLTFFIFPRIFALTVCCCQIWFSHCKFSGLTLFAIPFSPQALAEALKVNKTLTNIDLSRNFIDKAGAKAWCLA